VARQVDRNLFSDQLPLPAFARIRRVDDTADRLVAYARALCQATIQFGTEGIDRMHLRRIMALTPSMLHCLHTERPTVLIAPCDINARAVYEWLAWAGIDVPGQVSLVSFDNRISRIPPTLASVDFGFDFLGYYAFHTVMGTGGGAYGKRRDVPGKACVVEHGSLGTAAEGALPRL
jgi:DNA-binding LacI/PurR family transcriptional regulator